MLAPTISGLVAGILGWSAATMFNDEKSKSGSASSAAPAPVIEELEPMSLKTSSTPRVLEEQDTIGTWNAVVPILQRIKMNDYCNILYSTWHKCPLLVHEFLTKDIINGEAQRNYSFHQEKSVAKQFRVGNSYYSDTDASSYFEFDKGHMACAANYKKTPELMKSTFTYANIIPQNEKLNRNYWKNLQSYGRDLLNENKCNSLQVFSGPIYQSEQNYIASNPAGQPVPKKDVYSLNITVLKKNGLMVPTQFYKIYKCNTLRGNYASGFVLDNGPVEVRPFKEYEVPIEEIEEKTGILFNFKQEITSPLTQYDPKGTSQPKRK